MGAPQVPIAVDSDTGVWSVDGVPMILVPRHFFMNMHKTVESSLGEAATQKLWWDAGYRSALTWCETEAVTHGLHGFEIFRHYMARLSQRGWAQFSVLDHDPETGRTRIRADYSAFVLDRGPEAERKVCYMFLGWFAGALEAVARDRGAEFPSLTAEEIHCAAEGLQDHCLFELRPDD